LHNADPRIDGSRIDLQCPLEGSFSLSHCCGGLRSVEQGPPTHHEIPRIGIDGLFLLDSAARILHKFEVERPR
jgi:hypothetical protein